eukprot:TRINITY_DN37842_c0_g1_i1.p1 TRINITY_DN37842_c0_g1~~TRINITY_DN37842_c0_g1_i1.p1  ORF type:complete len:173 (+),score=12.92 TRINITY_DN37842_c0_g1_i1:46-519(+)
MQSLEVDWFFGIACRCPATVSVDVVLPAFPYQLWGHRSSQYGAMALLVRDAVADHVIIIPELSMNVGTLWFHVGSDQIWCGFSIPPRKQWKNEEERKAAVRQIFQDYDQALRHYVAASSAGSPIQIFFLGWRLESQRRHHEPLARQLETQTNDPILP